jgi:hypothetical protein
LASDKVGGILILAIFPLKADLQARSWCSHLLGRQCGETLRAGEARPGKQEDRKDTLVNELLLLWVLGLSPAEDPPKGVWTTERCPPTPPSIGTGGAGSPLCVLHKSSSDLWGWSWRYGYGTGIICFKTDKVFGN